VADCFDGHRTVAQEKLTLPELHEQNTTVVVLYFFCKKVFYHSFIRIFWQMHNVKIVLLLARCERIWNHWSLNGRSS
jgi:hypothetical protein